MRELFILVAHLLATLAKLMRPGGGSIATAFSRRPSRPDYQFAMHNLHNHIVAAHNVGVTKDEVVDWLIRLNGYLGTPRTNAALRVAREVWTKMANTPA